MGSREPGGISPQARALVLGAKIEIIPTASFARLLADVPAGATLTITCSPKFGVERTLAAAERAAGAGYHVVPHLAARQVTGEAELQQIAGRLNDAGVRDLYVIGGDAQAPAGSFREAAELLDALGGIQHRFTKIGVACYPEGHPLIPDRKLLDALRRKQPAAHYMVNQICFDVGALLGWLRAARAAGITLPLHLGLAAPLQVRKLVELSLKIGVGASLRFLTKQHGLVGQVLRGTAYQPEQLLLALCAELQTEPELTIERLHMFSFNQVAATVEWQRRTAGEGPVSTAG
jgi:methylenetetrahydrofolate reductase (NADPH)